MSHYGGVGFGKVDMKNSELLSTSAALAPQNIAGKLVVNYLKETKGGATASQILEHLRLRTKGEPIECELEQVVLNVLENGTALGFLERSASQFVIYRVGNMCKAKLTRRGRSKGPKRTIRRRIRHRRRIMRHRCRRRRS